MLKYRNIDSHWNSIILTILFTWFAPVDSDLEHQQRLGPSKQGVALHRLRRWWFQVNCSGNLGEKRGVLTPPRRAPPWCTHSWIQPPSHGCFLDPAESIDNYPRLHAFELALRCPGKGHGMKMKRSMMAILGVGRFFQCVFLRGHKTCKFHRAHSVRLHSWPYKEKPLVPATLAGWHVANWISREGLNNNSLTSWQGKAASYSTLMALRLGSNRKPNGDSVFVSQSPGLISLGLFLANTTSSCRIVPPLRSHSGMIWLDSSDDTWGTKMVHSTSGVGQQMPRSFIKFHIYLSPQ